MPTHILCGGVSVYEFDDAQGAEVNGQGDQPRQPPRERRLLLHWSCRGDQARRRGITMNVGSGWETLGTTELTLT